MAKADTISRLIDSGVAVFSAAGYEGASLREIATGAGVPLNTIHRYFGNKADLYAQVEQRIWNEINEERNRLLAAALSQSVVQLDAVLHAFVDPVIWRALEGGPGVPAVNLLRSSVTVHRKLGRELPIVRGYNRACERWLAAIRQATPALPSGAAVWAYSFIVGAMYSWQLIDHWFDELLQGSTDPSPGEVADMLVTFCRGGCEALAAKGGSSNAIGGLVVNRPHNQFVVDRRESYALLSEDALSS